MINTGYLMQTSVATVMLIALTGFAEEQGSSEPEDLTESASESAAASISDVARPTRVLRNPVTNQIEAGPGVPVSVLSLSARERNMLNRSDEGLRERVLPGRAVAVDLQGRFRNMATVTLDPESGELLAACVIDAPRNVTHMPEPGSGE